ncbi:MAG: DNA polymerase, partial [Acidobacteriota bacterium]|nr:DNA polymerase [Acidobacteriota bacterium]
IRTETGRAIRRAFVAEAGHVLISADYSQIELRVLAHFSRDEELLRAFRDNQDIHAFVAAQVAGISVDDFERRKASGKFGHIGMTESAHMVADVAGVPPERDVHEDLQPMIADREVRTEFLAVSAGQVTGVHQIVTIGSGGTERVRLELKMYVGADDPRDTFDVTGEPPLAMTIAGGVPGDHATAALTLNTALCSVGLRPGLRTVLDLPLRFR